MTKPARIFLSYAKADAAFAASISKELTKAGARPFDAAGLEGIKPGEDFFKRIRAELESSDMVVFVVPSQEGEGRWALAEIGAARALDKRILAILPDRARYSNAAFLRSLTDRPMVDATGLSPSSLADTIVSSASTY
jgi:hypothetical protein